MRNETEVAIWQFIHAAGWWWWGSIAALAAWNIVGIYKLAPARTTLGKTIRVLLLAGFMLQSLSWGNTAFGPLAIPLVYLGVRAWTHQMYLDCVRQGKVKPFWPAVWCLLQRAFHPRRTETIKPIARGHD